MYSEGVSITEFKGVKYYNIDPWTSNIKLWKKGMIELANKLRKHNLTVIAGVDSRGYGIASAIATILGIGWIMIRKGGKHPDPNKISVEYVVEYGEKRSLEVSNTAFKSTDRVAIIDDILATGCTIRAIQQLLNVKLMVCGVLIDLNMSNLDIKVESLITNTSQTSQTSLTSLTNLTSLTSLTNYNNHNVIMYHSSMESMALTLKNVYGYHVAEIKWNNFADGYPNISFDSDLINKDVVYLGSFHEHKDVLNQLMLNMVLPRQHIKSLTLVYPYFAPATMDRVDCEGMVATAEPFAKLMSGYFPMTKTGQPSLIIYDVHALQERFYFTDNIRIYPNSAIHLLLEYIDEDYVIVFPDDGAHKRFNKLFENFKTIVCSKIREGQHRYVRINSRNYALGELNKPTKAIIIDDLVQTGGTLFECMVALKKEGFTEVSAFVTHAVFPNQCYHEFLPYGSKAGFHKFYTTDSIPTANDLPKDFFVIIPLAPSINNTICKLNDIKPQRKVIVNVASQSKIKLSAIKKAFSLLYNNDNVIISGFKSESQVSNQPFDEETLTGARNRYDQILASRKSSSFECDYLISIENGIFGDPITGYYDMAYVIINGIVFKSSKYPISIDVVNRVIELDKKTTAGQIINPINADNWFPRIQILSECIINSIISSKPMP